ncbi:metallophosphoesterase domain-containing protein 1 [Lentinus tigrinus ALCF2SS1-7]|uniref:Metallophosphoesterase domain-containing protein 1 n=1 Tax=Lentinus tigrinus ALCF2SS1-6 TaxID=1328759 RepID=A0A5C2S2B0_9APHY|nr:metallophosphoesterase domain-containing protein 1 [Lentinus tigrinus ALCF2SS1-6]RPD78797.1 metallophosphoesterase domain-containing protein 1 [Lentinus tigrinus ALCF2SS1-7]
MSGLESILNRLPPTAWDRFTSSPLLFLARRAYSHYSATPLPPQSGSICVVCISDTHNTHRSQQPLPYGDILIHAGDLTQSGTVKELDDALAWLAAQPHPHKLLIAGNHDVALTSPDVHERIPQGLTYLQDSATELSVKGRTLRVYGSPHTPKQGSWPFQYPRIRPASFSPSSEEQATEIWSSIPSATDILITHGPPFGHLDINNYGCYALLHALWRVRPRLHVFGHIHGGRGVECVQWDSVQEVYEDICAGRAGWGGLVRLLWRRLVAWIWRAPQGHGSMLVNAAAVGGRGLRDDQRKGAIAVMI